MPARSASGRHDNPEDCQSVAAETAAAFGAIDVLVTVAFMDDSLNRKSPLESDADLANWRRAFEINLFGTMLITKAVLPHTIERARGGW